MGSLLRMVLAGGLACSLLGTACHKSSPSDTPSGGGGSVGSNAPSGWTCDSLFYGDGECDCDCGVGDAPGDCANAAPPILGCNPTQTGCNASGVCTGGRPTPPGWICKPDSYGDGVCDCACGAPDVLADCLGATAPINGCNLSNTGCDASGACTGGTSAPAGWLCPPDAYGDGTCHCGCGAPDLPADCGGTTAPIDGCNPTNTGCDPSGACTGGTPTPAGWTCPPDSFGDGTCHCGCGAPDLPADCAGAAAPFNGCNPTNTGCDASGACTGGTPTPAGWTCDPIAYDEGQSANPSCDCHCGAYDPDCDLPGASVVGCTGTQTCTKQGTCTGN